MQTNISSSYIFRSRLLTKPGAVVNSKNRTHTPLFSTQTPYLYVTSAVCALATASYQIVAVSVLSVCGRLSVYERAVLMLIRIRADAAELTFLQQFGQCGGSEAWRNGSHGRQHISGVDLQVQHTSRTSLVPS